MVSYKDRFDGKIDKNITDVFRKLDLETDSQRAEFRKLTAEPQKKSEPNQYFSIRLSQNSSDK
jgi:hypothetical protein